MDVRRWPKGLFYGIGLLALVLDQATKAWATASLRPLGSVAVIPGFFNLTYVRNTGVAFGMFAGEGLVVALIMIALIVAAFYYTRGVNWAGWESNLVAGFLAGGAIGNIADRCRLGYVVDFLDFYIGPARWQHWPTFNVADSLICVAVGWIVLRQLKTK